MAMRDLVTGGAACAVPGSSSSSNPFGALANAILGSSSKTQELKGLPGSAVNVPEASSDYRPAAPLTTIPGSEYESQQDQRPDARTSEFLHGFHSTDHGGLAEAWDEIHRSPVFPPAQFRENEAHFEEFERVYNANPLQPTWDGPPQRVLSSVLHSFLGSDQAGVPFRPTALPVLGLSEGDKQCIRDRSCIMARHIFADKSEEYIQSQVNALLHSLDIDSNHQIRGSMHGPHSELEGYWNESQGAMIPRMPNPVDGWITEFSQQRENDNPAAWANSFEQMHGANGWASEFEQDLKMGHMRDANLANLAAMEQSRMLAQTLGQNRDPKFQLSRGTDNWVHEFSKEHQRPDEKWVDEFSKLNMNDWVEEFGQQVSEGAFGESSADVWADDYDKYLDDQLRASKQRSGASRGVYVFSDMNPYVGHPNPLKEGQELFRKGLLSEAVLALEAEVLKNPDNAEGWRLLGITHAENDDDQQAIAAMMRAQEADPSNLEVLLALGVSHTNELEQAEALKYLYRWLQNHPKYGSLAPVQQADSLYYADVARLFNEAAQMSPEDADVHVVLGVLYNLSREYDKAIAAFQEALKIKPRDYSLWNKLGATQANSVQSADAILAYQQALDLKPNYVRAWANMGISYANQGLYEDSIRYYVRALAMNPKAENAWQYLRISLSCASRNDLFAACDSRNLDVLQKEFPL
ncbi:Peroxisome biogenesis protein 5 [Ananas comosus]|uniref:Peroxisome biogenesis protein 5 n=1 Tax=Ananas comosus TaxID=4615 RepID=A0A199VDU5_ANACO|nr:Peroxisome biogenesis protein 5 [Ananas comosus]